MISWLLIGVLGLLVLGAIVGVVAMLAMGKRS
jgi:hypothetical protein